MGEGLLRFEVLGLGVRVLMQITNMAREEHREEMQRNTSIGEQEA